MIAPLRQFLRGTAPVRPNPRAPRLAASDLTLASELRAEHRPPFGRGALFADRPNARTPWRIVVAGKLNFWSPSFHYAEASWRGSEAELLPALLALRDELTAQGLADSWDLVIQGTPVLSHRRPPLPQDEGWDTRPFPADASWNPSYDSDAAGRSPRP